MQSATIKNLCIALEALSRIPGTGPERLSERIHDLLDQTLTTEETRLNSATRNPSVDDDEIPF